MKPEKIYAYSVYISLLKEIPGLDKHTALSLARQFAANYNKMIGA